VLGPVGFARTVAIKRLHPNFARDPEFVAMFLDEARIAARVRHPNVVPTLDVVAADGELFLVMEYVEGESLARLVRASKRAGGPPPVKIACAIVAGALRGLHAAHEAKGDDGRPLGIVHRDVSPHNVLVGVDGLPRVLDFGVAKAIGRSQTTRDGQLKGKLPYMAPEQIRRGVDVTRRTDVYASSVVLWEALVARRLFDEEDEPQILAAVLDGKVTPPSAIEPTVPKSLDAIVLRGLARDPSARFETALEMAQAIESAVHVATTSEIGTWVGSLAHEALSERAMWVVHVESSGSIPAPLVEAVKAELATQASSVAVTTSTEKRVARRSANAIAIGAGFLVALAIGIATWIAWPPPKHDVVHATPASSIGASTSITQSVPSVAPTSTPTPSATPSMQPIATTSVTVKKPPPPGVKTKKPPAKNGPCDPPYYYKDGIKTFKPDCL
jgi:serine/threonine-protein kinase